MGNLGIRNHGFCLDGIAQLAQATAQYDPDLRGLAADGFPDEFRRFTDFLDSTVHGIYN